MGRDDDDGYPPSKERAYFLRQVFGTSYGTLSLLPMILWLPPLAGGGGAGFLSGSSTKSTVTWLLPGAAFVPFP
jgi:hypothetical protein